MGKRHMQVRLRRSSCAAKPVTRSLLVSSAFLALACGGGLEDDSADGASTDTGSSDDTSDDAGCITSGFDDLPPVEGSTACEGIAGGYYPIENLPGAHGWQASAGPTCPGEPSPTIPPCWGDLCLETVLSTSCGLTMPGGVWDQAAVYLRDGFNLRSVHRYHSATQTWQTLMAGTEIDYFAMFGESRITTYYGGAPTGTDVRLIDPATGQVEAFATRAPLSFDGATEYVRFGSLGAAGALYFDSGRGGTPGERSLCRWRMDSFEWESLAGPIPDSTIFLGAVQHGQWIYWANERIHVATLERQKIFSNSAAPEFGGSVVVDDRLWILSGSSCANTEDGCSMGGEGGLYYADLSGAACNYPKRVDIAADAYGVESSRLETDGERLYWQRRNYNDPMGLYNAQLVAFDPVTEELEVIFEFEEWGTGLSSYRVIGEYLYGIRHNGQLQSVGSLERLSLAAP